jgi:hypothetical protein
MDRGSAMKKSNLFKGLSFSNRQTLSSSGSRKVIFLLVLIFFLLFPLYSPWNNPQVDIKPSLLKTGFDLYFFVISQTLGVIHEAGHGVCYLLPCPGFITVLNGTLFQLAFPFGIALYCARRRCIVGKYLGLFLGGVSLHYTAWYLSTAHKSAIVPASKSFFGVKGYHDFHYLLDTLGLLPYDRLLSHMVHLGAYGVMIYALVGLFNAAFSRSEQK